MVEPDLFFVSKDPFSIITERNIQGVPDLLVEVLSPATEINDRRLKFSLYERLGVPEYRIVDPESRTVQTFRLAEGHYASSLELRKNSPLETPFLPGLSIPPRRVFLTRFRQTSWGFHLKKESPGPRRQAKPEFKSNSRTDRT